MSLKSITSLYTKSFNKNPHFTLAITNGVMNSFGDAVAQVLPSLVAGSPLPAFDIARSLKFLAFGASVGPLAGRWNHILEDKFPLRPDISSSKPTKDFPTSGTSTATSSSSSSIGAKSDQKKTFSAKDYKSAEQVVKDFVKSEEERIAAGVKAATGTSSSPPSAIPPVSLIALGKRVACDQAVMGPLSVLWFFVAMGVLEGLEDDEIKENLKNHWWGLVLTGWQVWPIVQLINFRFLPLKYRVPYTAFMGMLWTIYLSIVNARTFGELEEHHNQKNE